MRFKDHLQRPMFIILPQYDELFPKGSVQRVIDNFVNKIDLSDVEATYQEGGAPPYHPSVLLKVVLYAYTRNIYGCRPISDLCRQDMVCQWYTCFEAPSFSTINRFRSEHMGLERTVSVFSDLVRILVADGLVCFEECTYTDGSTMESRASRTQLVWAQTCRRYAEGNAARIEELVAEARQQQEADAASEAAASDAGETDAHGGGTEAVSAGTPEATAETADTETKGGKKKRGREVHMSAERVEEIRREMRSGNLGLSDSKREELEDRLDRADRYRREDDLCGDRSGTAVTDPDSVAMHPKDDVRRTGPCLPMYNMQMMTQNQFILWAGLYGRTTDVSVFGPFMQSVPGWMVPLKMAADAGYGSTENYLLAESLGTEPFFKYPLYDKECGERFKPSPYVSEYMPVLPDGSLQCPGGVMEKAWERTEEKNGVSVTTVCWRTERCAQCPHRQECHGKNPRDSREVRRKKEWAEIKPAVKARLDSDEGRLLLRNRSKDVEPTFAHTKWAGDYGRFRHFGVGKCTMDLFIRVIAHNLKKYAAAIAKSAGKTPGDGSKRLSGGPSGRPQVTSWEFPRHFLWKGRCGRRSRGVAVAAA